MDPMDDILSLFTAAEPDARQQALMRAQALRRQRDAGNLGLITGDRVLGGFGAQQVRQADESEEMLRQVGQQRLLQKRLDSPDLNALRRAQADETQLRTERARAGVGSLDEDLAALGKATGMDLSGLSREGAAAVVKQASLRRALEAKRQQAAEKAKGKAAGDASKAETDLRKELIGLPATKQFQEVAVSYDKIQRAAKTPSAAGDLSLIFGYMKILDPGSTVREGEFANAQNAGGVDDRIVAQYNRIRAGERLTEAQRADFINQAKGIYSSQKDQYDRIANQYRGLAKKAGAAPEDVVLQLATPDSAPAPAAPAVDPEAAAAALQWAKANPKDPRAAEILKRLGAAP